MNAIYNCGIIAGGPPWDGKFPAAGAMGMFGFGRSGRGRERIRRLLAAAAAAFLLGVQLFSSIYIASEADHDCAGDECPVCAQVHQCVANFQLTGSGLETAQAPAADPAFATDTVVPAEVFARGLSLVAQKVQFNE